MVTREDLRFAARELVAFLKREKIVDVEGLKARVGKKYSNEEDIACIEIVATPKLQNREPDTYAIVYRDFLNPGGVLRAGYDFKNKLVRMVLISAHYFDSKGYGIRTLVNEDIMQAKEIPIKYEGYDERSGKSLVEEKDPIEIMKGELESLLEE